VPSDGEHAWEGRKSPQNLLRPCTQHRMCSGLREVKSSHLHTKVGVGRRTGGADTVGPGTVPASVVVVERDIRGETRGMRVVGDVEQGGVKTLIYPRVQFFLPEY
jgi:hypothetical protein